MQGEELVLNKGSIKGINALSFGAQALSWVYASQKEENMVGCSEILCRARGCIQAEVAHMSSKPGKRYCIDNCKIYCYNPCIEEWQYTYSVEELSVPK